MRMADHHAGPRIVGAGQLGFQAESVGGLQCERLGHHRPDGTVPLVSAQGKLPITMLSDRVMVQLPRTEGERRSRSGILIPATADVSKRLTWAEVVAVGPHVRSVRAGDSVLFNPEDRYEVEVQGEDYIILRERDIHAVASERIDSGTGLYL